MPRKELSAAKTLIPEPDTADADNGDDIHNNEPGTGSKTPPKTPKTPTSPSKFRSWRQSIEFERSKEKLKSEEVADADADADASAKDDEHDEHEGDGSFEHITIADAAISPEVKEPRTPEQHIIPENEIDSAKRGVHTDASEEVRRSALDFPIPETLEEAIRHYHAALEEADSAGLETMLHNIVNSHSGEIELLELARHDTLQRLTRLTAELFHRSLETKQLYQLVQETVLGSEAKMQALEKKIQAFEIMKRHKEEDEADLASLKAKIKRVEKVALQHAPLNDGGLLEAIEDLKLGYTDAQTKYKKRRKKEYIASAGTSTTTTPS